MMIEGENMIKDVGSVKKETSKTNKSAKSAIIIVIFGLASKFLGFVRETLIAAKFGSGMETDTFFIALAATSLVTAFISNAIATTFIPVLSEIESKEGKRGKIDHTNNMMNVVFVITAILVALGYFIAPLTIRLLARGFEGAQFDLAVSLTRMGLPMILFSGLIGILTGYLQSEQRFTSSSAVGIPYNFLYIFFLLFLSSIFGIKGLMVAGVVAVISKLLIQVPEARSAGYSYSFKFDLKDTYVQKVLLLSVPVLVGVAIDDLNAIVDKTLASDLAAGSISSLNYANKLNGLMLGVFIGAITTVIFPLLSKESNDNNIAGMKKIMAKGIDLILIITVPATVGLVVLSTPIIQVAFERGEFDALATDMTSPALKFYSVGLVAMAMRLLLTRVYYSLQDTKTPMINGAIAVVFNIGFNLVLVRSMGHAGLALATSIAATITSLLLLRGLRKKIGPLGIKVYTVTLLKTGLASIIMGFAAYLIYYGVYGLLGVSKIYNLLALLIAAGLGALIYGILCYLMRVEAVRYVFNKAVNKIKNKE